MNKIIASVMGLLVLAGCSGYDYYKTDVRYRQKGEDCVYYFTEDGKKFNNEIRTLSDDKKIVYRNTDCKDLYMKDTLGFARNERKVVLPVFTEDKPMPAAPAAPTCGCNKCAKKQVLKNRFVIVPAFEG